MANPIKTRTAVSRAFAEAHEAPPEELPKELQTLQKFVIDAVEYDCRNFAKQISIWKDNKLYLHFEPTWEDFISKHIKQPIEWVDHMLNGLEILNSRPTPINATDWIAESKSAPANLAKQLGESPTIEVKPKGGNYNPDGRKGKQKDESKNLSYYNNLDSLESDSADRGDSPEYLAARIARDRPDIQTKMKQGEYPSVRAAAVDAGIVKPRIQVTWKDGATPEQIATAILKKVSPELIGELVKWLDPPIEQ
jgi:hypothetical protein